MCYFQSLYRRLYDYTTKGIVALCNVSISELCSSLKPLVMICKGEEFLDTLSTN